MKHRNLIAAALLSLFTGAAQAGLADDASERVKAIAVGDVDKIVAAYGEDATLQWVGGPLNGTYAGTGKLREVWSKFTKAQGELAHTLGRVEESANDKGATVVANVEFRGKNTIKVRYLLVYRDGKLVNEVWQIDPKLMLGY